ncbi:MAG: NUDIX hydrolase [Longimicrobiales bacterium]
MTQLSELPTLLGARFGPVDRALPDGPGKQAAVALVLRPGAARVDEPLLRASEILIIKRAKSERDPWSGHMAFPGGRVDPADTDLVQTAVRETLEETEVGLAGGPVIGRLDPVYPAGPGLPQITIWPFVFRVPTATYGAPDLREVETLHWFSVADLVSEANRGTHRLHHRGKARAFPCPRLGGHVIWGLTFRILTQFLEVDGAESKA